MTTDNFCFYLQNRLIQTSETGGQQYSDTSPFSIPWVVQVKHKLMKLKDLTMRLVKGSCLSNKTGNLV